MKNVRPAPLSGNNLEAQLREEAKRQRPPPSPHLHTRTMAEISAIHQDRTARTGLPWWSLPATVVATIVVLLAIAQPDAVRRGSRTQPGAGLTSFTGNPGWRSLERQAAGVSRDVDALVAEPFGREFDALSKDAERAAAFLAGCLPQARPGMAP